MMQMMIRRLVVRPLSASSLVVVLALALVSSAQANWGPKNNCGYKTSKTTNEHCYALAERGGVSKLASIAFEDTTSSEVPHWENGEIFTSNEEWISFEGHPGWIEEGWIEDGQLAGAALGCCEMHPFYAEEYKGTLKLELSPGTMPLNRYNHYVIFDSEVNGRWHLYWESGEAGYYGGGWPTYYNAQEAGIEASDNVKPYEWGRDEVAASNGGEWSAWTGATKWKSPGICQEANIESGAAGNTMWGTEAAGGAECL
jgi:hypothetical protein